MTLTAHPAWDTPDDLPVIFTAHSAETAYLKEKICAHVLQAGGVPLNPFMVAGYFLYGLVEKDLIRRANNTLVRRSDELWVYGVPSDGVAVEIIRAGDLGMPVRYFSLSHHGDEISELSAPQGA